jgi:hypothetical protein
MLHSSARPFPLHAARRHRSGGRTGRSCHRRGFDPLALTDTNALHGAVAFAKACRAAGIQPSLGTTAMERMIRDCTLCPRTKARWNSLRALVQRPAMMSEIASCQPLLTVAGRGFTLRSRPANEERDALLCPPSLGTCPVRQVQGRRTKGSA